MKNKKLLILSFTLLFSLNAVSCNNTSSSSNPSTSSSEVSSSSSSSFIKETEWNTSIKEVMNEILGTTLPFVSLDEYKYETYKNDSNIDELSIYELNSSESKIELIRQTFINEGFTLTSRDSSLGYDRYFMSKTDEDGNGAIYITYGFVPSNIKDATFNGNFIKAYHIYMEKEYSKEEINLMNEKIGYVLPYLPVTNAHTYEYSENYNYILMKDITLDGDLFLFTYASILTNAGFSLNMTSDFQEYFTLPHPTHEDKEIVVAIIDMRSYSYSTGVAYQVFERMKVNEVTSMPYEQMKAYFGSDFNETNIPEITNFTYLGYSKNSTSTKEDGYFYLEANLKIDDIYAYVNKLQTLGYEITYSSTSERYIALSFDELIRIDYVYDISEGSTTGTLQMKITLSTPTYTTITSEFPTSYVGENYPSFTASKYKVIDSSNEVTIKVNDLDNSLTTAYRKTLNDNGFNIKYNSTNGHYEASKDNLKVEFYLSGTTFIVIYSK